MREPVVLYFIKRGMVKSSDPANASMTQAQLGKLNGSRTEDCSPWYSNALCVHRKAKQPARTTITNATATATATTFAITNTITNTFTTVTVTSSCTKFFVTSIR
mmetsp:Transcript_31131/g.52563  ORF Transcript_31131/g.52563 Transcript_31131/m.52563 type:complete len:104 (+) Transcript_31131:150-461(+)